MAERRESRLAVLVLINAALSLCVLIAIPWALDRLGDRLTAAISEEVHSQMWETIRQNQKLEADERLRLEEDVIERLGTQDILITTWRENVIRKHPDLGDKR